MSCSREASEEREITTTTTAMAKKCKIRKRVNCSSSTTSSSSLVRKYRFKREILMGKRGGSSTPAPMWETVATPSAPPEIQKGKEASARKLAATLWEINHQVTVAAAAAHSSSCCKKKDVNCNHNHVVMKKKPLKSREKLPKLPSQSASLPPHLPDPSYTHSNKMQRRVQLGGGGGVAPSHPRTMSAVTQKLQLTDFHHLGRLDSLSTASFTEVEDHHSRGKTLHKKHGIEARTRLKEVSNGIATSKELLKLLHHIWGLEDQRSLSMSLFSALRFELDRAFIQVDRFIQGQRANRNEIECLMKHFAEEKAEWRSKEQERIQDAISCMAEELKAEKKLRRQTERLNKKIGKELADRKATLSGVMKELEREKRAKEILEQVCDELARGIGEDRAQVEQIKRESEKVRKEVEKERQMLQLADVLREERVQMKLSEAKYQFEEKNAAVEQLKNELETYLRSKISGEDGEGSPKFDKIKKLEAYLKEIDFGSSQKPEKEEAGKFRDREEHEGDDSGNSDLHSIELNMDNNNRSYNWSFVCGDEIEEADVDDSKLISVDRQFKGRKSISEKIQWRSICLNRSGNDIDLKFSNKTRGQQKNFI